MGVQRMWRQSRTTKNQLVKNLNASKLVLCTKASSQKEIVCYDQENECRRKRNDDIERDEKDE